VILPCCFSWCIRLVSRRFLYWRTFRDRIIWA